MSQKPPLVTYKGRRLGIVILTAAQALVGVIHILSGLLMLAYELTHATQFNLAYDVYTLTFGLLTLVFAVYIWRLKRVGWIGTITVSSFVIAADALTLLGLPSIPGIPMSAAYLEIAYSVVIVLYLLQPDVQGTFR